MSKNLRFLVKINIDFIKTFPNQLTFFSHKINEFQCRISNFDEMLFTPRIYKVGVFLHRGKKLYTIMAEVIQLLGY